MELKTGLILVVAGIFGGFLTGFVGIGSVVFLVLMLKDLNLHIEALGSTIILIVLCATFLGITNNQILIKVC